MIFSWQRLLRRAVFASSRFDEGRAFYEGRARVLSSGWHTFGRLGAKEVCTLVFLFHGFERFLTAPASRVYDSKPGVATIRVSDVDTDLRHGHLTTASGASLDAFHTDAWKEECPDNFTVIPDRD